MYWRVQKFDSRDVLKRYGVHIALVLSLSVNVFMMATRPSKSQMAPQVKKDFEQFARTVTNHLLDTSYISFDNSTAALTDGGELSTGVVALLRQQGMLAKSVEEQKATLADLKKARQVSAVRIDEVNVSDLDSQSLMPIEVKGVVAIHSAEDSGPSGAVPFRFVYLIGVNQKTSMPVVARFQDLSQKPNS